MPNLSDLTPGQIVGGLFILATAMFGKDAFWALIGKLFPSKGDKAAETGKILENEAASVKLIQLQGGAAAYLRAEAEEVAKEMKTLRKELDDEKKLRATAEILVQVKDGQIQMYQDAQQAIILREGRSQEARDRAEHERDIAWQELAILRDRDEQRRERKLERENDALTKETLQLKGEAKYEVTLSGPDGEDTGTPD